MGEIRDAFVVDGAAGLRLCFVSSDLCVDYSAVKPKHSRWGWEAASGWGKMFGTIFPQRKVKNNKFGKYQVSLFYQFMGIVE